MAEQKTDYWAIKHVDTDTRRKFKTYAVAHGMPIAQVLALAIDALDQMDRSHAATDGKAATRSAANH